MAKVLIVDDDELLRDLVRHKLTRAGFEVLRSIREQPALANLPVVMLTARDQEEDVLNGLALGAQDYIVKPFLPDEVVLRIRRLVGPLRQAS